MRRPFRLGVFTRLVDRVEPREIYARGLRLFERAEELGLDSAWVAQHHAHNEGGLPAPLVFLGAAAMRTRRITLATGIITLPLEDPLRLAEDASVLDTLSDGRLELGLGTGGNEAVFTMFGRQLAKRQQDYEGAFTKLQAALRGEPLLPDGPSLFPPASARLVATMWEAAMSMSSSVRAGEHGSGLLLARTAPRDASTEGQHLGVVQKAFVDAYLEHFPEPEMDCPPRVGLSRSIYVAPTRAQAFDDAEPGMRRHAQVMAERTGRSADLPLVDLFNVADLHIGAPDDVVESLRADPLLAMASDLILQVHPIDPTPEKTLQSLELIATEVAPALGWKPA